MSPSPQAISASLISIGNSKGIRLPKAIIQKYGFGEKLLLETKANGILIRTTKKETRLSWKETYQAMAKEKEAWHAFDEVVADGLDEEFF